MTSSSALDEVVARECAVLTAYLIGRGTTHHTSVVGAYIAAHHRPELRLTEEADDALVALARHSPVAARLASAYARLFAPTGILRRKLVLLLAILETSAPSHVVITHPPAQALPMALITLSTSGLVGIVAAIVSIPVVTVWKLYYAGRRK